MDKAEKKISGNIDHLSKTVVRGWAGIRSEPDKRLCVRVIYGDKCIATGIANLKRDDLVRADICGGRCAFSIAIDDLPDLEKVVVVAKDPETGVETILPRSSLVSTGDKRMGYQTFGDQHGDSDSNAKLLALRLPNSFDGYKVLDIGCNEGFFCIESLRRGAAKVIGIDANKDIIERARRRTDKVEYRVASWWEAPEESFDIIFFLSAIHYEKNQRDLLNMLSRRLTSRGKLILECGVIDGPGKSWKVIRRNDGFMRYPTKELLLDLLLADFAVTSMGRSVTQAGDPIPRFVFHCSRLRSTYLLVGGKPGTGKSNFARIAGKAGNHSAFYSTDTFFHEVKSMKESDVRGDALLARVHEECNLVLIDGFIAALVKDGMAETLACKILEHAPIEAKFMVLEGYALEFPQIERAIISQLEKRGGIVWRAQRTTSGVQ